MRLAEQNAQLLELQGRRPHTSLAKQFIDLGAKEFSGTIDPAEAENWLKDAVRILNRMGVANDDKVDLVTFMFKGEALHWWEATERLLTMLVSGVVPVVPQRITWARIGVQGLVEISLIEALLVVTQMGIVGETKHVSDVGQLVISSGIVLNLTTR
ncbi:hypothetical protein Vadar_021915 [Vaccinium darrowii]|uniref:Uncharacterized protein n=1 Tax=Vaccinium darrowii TaxID=229202 RepID=A0ACB7X2W3_9ERIC|nr:hypothetical protein Vadar_021915 [Vaccinium darrowii]